MIFSSDQTDPRKFDLNDRFVVDILTAFGDLALLIIGLVVGSKSRGHQLKWQTPSTRSIRPIERNSGGFSHTMSGPDCMAYSQFA